MIGEGPQNVNLCSTFWAYEQEAFLSCLPAMTRGLNHLVLMYTSKGYLGPILNLIFTGYDVTVQWRHKTKDIMIT